MQALDVGWSSALALHSTWCSHAASAAEVPQGMKSVRENQEFCRSGGTNLPVIAAKRRKIKAHGVSVGKKWETIKPRRGGRIGDQHKKKGTERTRFPIGCVPSPRVQRQTCYCILVKAWQAASVATGRLPAAPGLKRITPSSVEQKLRTPEMLYATGEVPETNAVNPVPAGVRPVAANT